MPEIKEISNKCSNCGAPIKWDGSSFVVRCEYCDKKTVIGNNPYNFIEYKLILSQIKKNLKFILPSFGLLILIFAYINSRKIPTYNFVTRAEAKAACEKYEKKRKTSHKVKVPCENCKKETHAALKIQNFDKDKDWTCHKGKNNPKQYESILMTDMNYGFGAKFDSYNKCIRKEKKLTENKDKELNNSYITYFRTSCIIPYLSRYEQAKEVLLNVTKWKAERIFKFKEG